MAKINATNVKLLIGAVEIGNLENCDLEVNREYFDVTTKDSGDWKENLKGLMDWKMGGSITIDYALTMADDDIFTALLAGTDLTIKFGVVGSGNIQYSGTGHYTQQSKSAGVQEKYSSKFSVLGTGVLTQSTQV